MEQLARPTAVDIVHCNVCRSLEGGGEMVSAMIGVVLRERELVDWWGERVARDDAGASFAVGAVRGIMVEDCVTCSEDGWQCSENGQQSGA